MGTSKLFTDDDLRELERMVPPEFLNEVSTQNPLSKVFFRAGLLACREYMARFVEQGGNSEIAGSIRANWWPVLGSDPGAPRKFRFEEIASEYEREDGSPGWEPLPLDPSFEALPIALAFLTPEEGQ